MLTKEQKDMILEVLLKLQFGLEVDVVIIAKWKEIIEELKKEE